MASLESPVDPNVKQMIDRTFQAARMNLRPREYKSQSGELNGGHYRTAFATGLTTILNAGDAIVSCRWTDAQRLLELQRLAVMATIVTAFGTAQETSVDLVKLSGFSAPDTGGTDVKPVGLVGAKGRGMLGTQLADLRVATTVALGAGTATAEARPNGFAVLPLGNAVGASAGGLLFEREVGEHSLQLAALEGFRVRIGLTQGATGVVRFTFVMDWAEVAIS